MDAPHLQDSIKPVRYSQKTGYPIRDDPFLIWLTKAETATRPSGGFKAYSGTVNWAPGEPLVAVPFYTFSFAHHEPFVSTPAATAGVFYAAASSKMHGNALGVGRQ